MEQWKAHLVEGHLMQQKRKGHLMQQQRKGHLMQQKDHLMKRHLHK